MTKLFMQTSFRWIRALQEKQMSCTILLSIRSGVKYVSRGKFFAFNAMLRLSRVFFPVFLNFFFLSNFFSLKYLFHLNINILNFSNILGIGCCSITQTMVDLFFLKNWLFYKKIGRTNKKTIILHQLVFKYIYRVKTNM